MRRAGGGFLPPKIPQRAGGAGAFVRGVLLGAIRDPPEPLPGRSHDASGSEAGPEASPEGETATNPYDARDSARVRPGP